MPPMDRHRRTRAPLALLLVFALILAALPLAPVARAMACTVTSAADSGPNTLRAALGNSDNFASLIGGCTAIGFNLPGAGPWTITLAGALPQIARDLAITGPGKDALIIQG